MTTRKLLLAVLALSGSTLLINACSSNDDRGPAGPPSTTSLADQQITGNTNDTALPISINDAAQVSDEDNSDTALPMAI